MAAVEEVVVGERKGGGSVEREHGEGGYVHKQMMDFNQAEVMLVPKRIKKLGRRYRGEKKE